MCLQHSVPGSSATVGRLLLHIAMETREPGAGCWEQVLTDPAVCAYVCVKDERWPSGMPPSHNAQLSVCLPAGQTGRVC